MSTKPLRVFISYAWESDDLKTAIWELAGWLQNSGYEIKVVTDHDFSFRPPPKGWTQWMIDQIEEADVVLIVCTSKYYKRFHKKDTEDGGLGVTHEGCIISQELYEQKGINNKFFPITPDGGDNKNVPVTLRAYVNNHCFPTGNSGILRLVRNDNPAHKTTVKTEVQIEESVKFEKEIVIEIVAEVPKEKEKMVSPIQTIVRAFLQLGEYQKIQIMKSLDFNLVGYGSIGDRDKEFFKKVNEKNLLRTLWSSINNISPFEDQTNPF